MKTDWDCTALADAYLKRPDYADAAIDSMLSIAGVIKKSRVCDVGSGVAHLTLMLAARKYDVASVEPSNAMRVNERQRAGSFGKCSLARRDSGINWAGFGFT
jgi:16S rRNA A1518/A1519 N6-dimethyltransferase RsmA/KsgA/DIM1 with predicted DNA glycosylase/AP lyase activity